MLRQLVLALGAWAVVGATIVVAEDPVFSMRGLLKQHGKNKNKDKKPKCKDAHGKGCPAQSDHCPSYSVEPNNDGTTTITVDYSCLKDGSISYVVVDEGCDGHCDGKMEGVYGSSATYKYKLDTYACEDTVCIYAKDGQFEHVPGEHEDVPSCAYSSKNQLCQICPYRLEVVIECTNPDTCETGPGNCATDGPNAGTCVYSPVDCNDPGTCETGTGNCATDGPNAGTCVYSPVECNDPGTCETGTGTCATDGPNAGTCVYSEVPNGDSCDDSTLNCPECVNGSCQETVCAANSECCDGNVCNGGICGPCVPPEPGACDANNPCCEGFVCNNMGTCVECPEDVGCAVCPAGGLGVCADVPGSEGQATCGDVTCTAVCQLFCGTPDVTYDSNDCNNAGGGNCGGAISQLDGITAFDGGPCCKCTRGCRATPGGPRG